MRDQRFVAVHRGGPLDRKRHQHLAIWAAKCGERVLPLFEQESRNKAPRRALEAAQAWAQGHISTGAAQKASSLAHAAARESRNPRAIAAARTAGQAAATAHFADHSLVAAYLGQITISISGASPEDEWTWQKSMIPASILNLVISGMELRFSSAFLNRRSCQTNSGGALPSSP